MRVSPSCLPFLILLFCIFPALPAAAHSLPATPDQQALWRSCKNAVFAEARRWIASVNPDDGTQLDFTDLHALIDMPAEIASNAVTRNFVIC